MAARQHSEARAYLDTDNEEGKEGRRSAIIDELGSEVFNLKLALQEYEDRLAKLYQTEDRSKWKGPATLLTDLEVADREVDRLENTVADLRDQLQEARGGGCGGGDGEEKSDCMLSAKTRHQYEVDIGELRDEIAALEEDNRVLADAAGWELCEGSEGEEEDALLVPTGPSQRIRVIEGLSSRMQDLTLLLDSALARESDARVAAEDAVARMDDAVARTEELEAAVLHYKRGEVSAEGRESALKSEVDELRSRGDTEGAAVEGKEKTTATVGVMARPEAGEGLSTRATGVNTEEGWPGVDESSDKLTRLEADALRWQEACERTNAQLRKERSLGEETAQRLSEKETAVRELTKRLRDAEQAAATATAALAAEAVRMHSPTGVRPHHDHPSFERQTERRGRGGGDGRQTEGRRLGGGGDSNTDEPDETNENGSANRTPREERDDAPSFASADASNVSYDSYTSPAMSAASTDEDPLWKARARASAETHEDAADAARKNTEPGRAAAEGGHTRTSLPCSRGGDGREGDNNSFPVPKQRVAAVTAAPGEAFHGEEGGGDGEQAGRGGVGQQQKQNLQRLPRWANQKHGLKHAGAAAGRLQQKQQPEEQHPIEGLDLDPRPPGFPTSSLRRRRRRDEVGAALGGDFGDDGGGDLGDVDDDELSTAECSAETTGGGRDAIGVSFDVASDRDGLSSVEHEEIEEAADGSGNRPPPQPRQGRERWHQQQRSGSDGWRSENGADDASSMQPAATVAGGVPGRGGERVSGTPRAESAARRAEASALRAERAAESARLDRDGAELAAVEADAAVAAAKVALKISGVPTPSHGYFTGANALRPQPTNQLSVENGEFTACRSDRSSDTEGRRAARLAERASLMARLEALAAATEAERAARSTTGRRGQIRTPRDGSTATVDAAAAEGEKGIRDWLEEKQVSTDGLERVAAVGPTSGSGAGTSSTVGAGTSQASGRTQDVDYWNRPVAMAAAVAATKTSRRHGSRRHRTSSKTSRSETSVASTEGGGAKDDPAARVEDAGESKSGAAGQPDDRHHHPSPGTKSPTIPPPLPLLSVGRKRLAEVGVGQAGAQGAAAVEATTEVRPVSQEARRRRVLQHVEVGRGGQEHYRDAAKQRPKPAEDDLLYGLDLGPGGADAYDDDGGEAFENHDGERFSASSENYVRHQGAGKMVGGAGVGTGMARSSPRPKKKSIKKRKSRPAARAAGHTAPLSGGQGMGYVRSHGALCASAPLGGRQAMGYVHAHGALCARRCASPACPCGEAAAVAATAWRFRSGVVGIRR